MRFGRFTLIPAQRILLRDDEPVQLGSRAFDLLTVLAENAGSLVPKEVLMERVWPNSFVDEGSLRVHVALLRKGLREEHTGERHITNVPRRGYSLATAVVKLTHEEAPSLSPALARRVTAVPPLSSRIIARDNAIRQATETVLHKRLLTLAGPGGIGKTTVAVAAAQQLESNHDMPIFFADLAALREGTGVEAAVAGAAELPALERKALVAAMLALDAPRFLLVLDTCEHVIESAATFATDLLAHVPGAHVIATSREPLRTRSEWVQRVQPLAVPPGGTLRFDEARGYPAFQLFVDRAEALVGARLGDADVPAASRLCRSLEGNPLAIELAAAQTGSLGLDGVLACVDSGRALPPCPSRSGLPRHQSMAASLDWSFRLLSEPERRTFVRLASFSTPFTLEDATANADDSLGYHDTVLALMGLVDKSLVWAEGTGSEMRFRLCETTRAFATHRLEELLQ
jgi:predicted ATPase/DNA-binding winged helix-turn-helix (wHTH) protein